MKRSELDGLVPFLAVVEHGGFRAAARALGVTSSAVSQAVKTLEGRLGVPLLIRSTRSVGLTQAGASLAERCRPALSELTDAVESVRDFGERPAGLLRINAPRIALPVIFEPVLGPFREAYPDIQVEMFLDDRLSDIAREGFDAGIRLGQSVEADMVSTHLTPPSRMAIVASPEYLAAHGTPESPDDLAEHRCINFRRPTRRTVYRWRFIDNGESRQITVNGDIVVNDPNAKLFAARSGFGLAYEIEPVVRADVEAGRLVQVLSDWLPTIPGFHIYFPSRAQVMLKLRVFIDFAQGILLADERDKTMRAAGELSE